MTTKRKYTIAKDGAFVACFGRMIDKVFEGVAVPCIQNITTERKTLEGENGGFSSEDEYLNVIVVTGSVLAVPTGWRRVEIAIVAHSVHPHVAVTYLGYASPLLDAMPAHDVLSALAELKYDPDFETVRKEQFDDIFQWLRETYTGPSRRSDACVAAE